MIICPVCSSNSVKFIRKYSNIHHSFENLNIFSCINCNLVFVNPMPLDEVLFEFNSTYFESAHGGHSGDKASKAFFSGISKLRASYLNSYLCNNEISAKRILEIGPGPGYFANNWLENNPEVEYFAIESDESCYSSLQNFGVKIIQDFEYHHYQNSIDMIIMSHVLEHVSNPVQFVDFISGFLKKGGVLFIEVPCNDWQHKNIDEPHLLFFDKKSKIILLENAGFSNIQTGYFGQNINQLINKSIIKKVITSIRSQLINFGFGKLFGYSKKGLEILKCPIERAVLKPFCAHIESLEPSWWLRSVSIKK
jgi:SAM-dependent methyltransferase